jgi:hypothetical protein
MNFTFVIGRWTLKSISWLSRNICSVGKRIFPTARPNSFGVSSCYLRKLISMATGNLHSNLKS